MTAGAQMGQDKNIRLYMFLRLLMLHSVLLSTVLKAPALTESVLAKTLLITFFTFLVTTAFIFLYEKARNVHYFPASQIAYDILFTTALIFYIGPFDAMFTMFYFFNIIFAAILFRGRGALVAALLSGGMYIGISMFNLRVGEGEKLFPVLPTVTAFIAIALLAGQLVEELSRSRQKITRLEQLSEEIVDSLDSGLLGLDPEDRIQRVNRTAMALLGAESSELLSGGVLRDVFPALGGLVGSEVREVTIQGTRRRLLASRIALPDNHSMILIRDLTDVLELEERLRRQERLASVGRLAAGLAHEIRNPIASISGSAQLLSDPTGDAAESRRLLDIIVRESERVDRLVSQLLKFSKPSASPREKIELREFLDHLADAARARPDCQEQGIAIDVQVEPSLVVEGIRDELAEAVSNLLVNSIQALSEVTARPGKKIRIEARKRQGLLEITVKDNGPGIPKEFRGRIFDPFFTTKPEGTGLGLARVYKVIRDHDGQVDVESDENTGTALRIRLPA